MDFFLQLGERLGEALPKIAGLCNNARLVAEETEDEAYARQEMAAARAHLNDLVAQQQLEADNVAAEAEGSCATRQDAALPTLAATNCSGHSQTIEAVGSGI